MYKQLDLIWSPSSLKFANLDRGWGDWAFLEFKFILKFYLENKYMQIQIFLSGLASSVFKPLYPFDAL